MIKLLKVTFGSFMTLVSIVFFLCIFALGRLVFKTLYPMHKANQVTYEQGHHGR